MFRSVGLSPYRDWQDMLRFQSKLLAGMKQLRGMHVPEYANTPRELVYREDKLSLWHMRGERQAVSKTPLLIVYALVNTVWMTDLQADRSLVRNLLAQGEDVYLIDWGYPDGADRWLTLDDYLNTYLDHCVEVIRVRHGRHAIDLLGICQGGTFSLCYTAMHPEKVRHLVTMVTPVDFHAPDNMLSTWVQDVDVDLLVDTLGNVPAELMNWIYLMLKPARLLQQKYVHMVDMLDKPMELKNFLRMERWIFDSPDQAGEAFRQFLKDFYQGNKLIKGQLKLAGRGVDLAAVKQPVLNIYAEKDHLVPPAASRALAQYVGSSDYTEQKFNGGHIGIYVSTRAQREVAPSIHRWLRARS